MKKLIMLVSSVVAVVGLNVASANVLYVNTGIATTGDNCSTLNLTGGVKIDNGYGPQVRVSTFDGSNCDTSDTRVALEVRKDMPLYSNTVLTLTGGVESDSTMDDSGIVGSVGVNKVLSSGLLVGANVFNSYPDGEDSETFVGANITYTFK